MTSARKRDGSILHFPTIRDAVNVIEAPRPDELAVLADEIDPAAMLLFTRRLLSGAMKKGRNPRWQKVNRARLELARFCLDRMIDRASA